MSRSTWNTLRAIMRALVVLAFAVTLGSIWWWALLGMDENIGLAWMLTVTVLLASAAALNIATDGGYER